MAQFATKYTGRTTTGPSPQIWDSCPVMDMIEDPGVGYYFFDDFVSPQNAADAKYTIAGNTSPEPTQGTVGGQFTVSTVATLNHYAHVATGNDFVVISETAGTAKKLWFEARFQTSTTVTRGLLLGLVAHDDIGAGLIVDTGTPLLLTANYIGFRIISGDSDGLDIAYQIASGGELVVKELAQTVVASTWYKVGFVFDPDAPTASRIKFYVDGVDCGSYVTGANIAAATFPKDVEMAMIYAIKTSAAAAITDKLDWWRCAQLR